jgi:Tfp pilus assembly protein PilV
MKQFYKQGFALLETLIGIIICGIAGVGIAMLMSKLIKADTLAYQRYEASTIAEQKMESLRNYSNLTDYDNIVSGNDTVTGKNATYTRTWAVVTTASPAYKTVTITVTWTSTDNTSESLAISSMIGDSDPSLTGRAISLYSPVLP